METRILQPNPENIRLCAQRIKSGGVVAFPTETVYGLGASAFEPRAVREIFRIKGRPNDNPLIVHVSSLEQIREIADLVSPLALKLISAFMPGALTLVMKRKSCVPDCVTAGLDTVGVRMPSNEACRKFLAECGVPVAAPSANTSTRPSPTCAEHVYDDLRGKIPYVLDGGECEIGLESTILDVSGVAPKLLRAGGISIEELERVCGLKIQTVSSTGKALCPGMKYKHYSPKAEVYFSAYYGNMFGGINAHYDLLVSSGKNPVILCLDKNASLYGARKVYRMGADYGDYARMLFASLRRADSQNYDSVIAEGVPSEGIGAAIINRLVKSSGGKII